LPFAWAALWVGGAVFQALPGQNTGGAVAAALGSGDPGWLGRVDASVGGWTSRHGAVAVGVLVVAEALVGLAALSKRTRVPAVAAGVVLALAIWVVAQDAGQLYTGQATDPNTAPLIMLSAIAILGGYRARVGARVEARGPGAWHDLREGSAARS
jgi:hypothetical protein